jgi:hypothetical protein
MKKGGLPIGKAAFFVRLYPSEADWESDAETQNVASLHPLVCALYFATGIALLPVLAVLGHDAGHKLGPLRVYIY